MICPVSDVRYGVLYYKKRIPFNNHNPDFVTNVTIVTNIVKFGTNNGNPPESVLY